MRIFQETSNEVELLKLQGKLKRLRIVDDVVCFAFLAITLLVGYCIIADGQSLFSSAGKEQSGSFGLGAHIAFYVFSWIPLMAYVSFSAKRENELGKVLSKLQPSLDYELESKPEIIQGELEVFLAQSLENAYAAKHLPADSLLSNGTSQNTVNNFKQGSD